MKTLNTYINESLLKDFFTSIKKTIFNKAKQSEMKVNGKQMTMDELIKYVDKNIKKYEKNKSAETLIKDVTEIINNDITNFKKIVPLLKEWTKLKNKDEYYKFDTIIKNDECTKYLQNICKILTNKYKWESFEDTEFELYTDENGDYEEGVGEEWEVYNTAFLAFILATLADEILNKKN